MKFDDEVLWPRKGRMSLDRTLQVLRRVIGTHCTIAIRITPDPSGEFPPSIVEA